MVSRQQRYHYQVVVPAGALRVSPVRRRKGLSTDDRVAVATGSLFLLASLGIALILLAVYAYFTLFALVLPGVRVGGVDLGGMSMEQATDELAQTWAARPSVRLADGTRKWAVSPASLGFTLDAEATAAKAYEAGRVGDGWVDPLALGGQEIAPVVGLNETTARSQLEQAARQVNTAPLEAAVNYKNGHWSASPGRNGATIDIDATLAFWKSNPGELLRIGLLPLKMRAEAPQVMDASSHVARLESLMKSPLAVQAFDPVTNETLNWTVPPEIVAGWVQVEKDNGQPLLKLNIAKVSVYLQGTQNALGPGRYLDSIAGLDTLNENWQAGKPLTAIVKHHPTSYTVQAGDNLVSIAFKVGIPWWKIRDANPGINPDALSAGQQITIPSKDVNLPLPVVANKRIVISISQQRLWTYENGRQRTESVISTGIARSPTMPGVFQVQTHDINAYASIWDLTMPHFLGIYEAAPGFMNGIHGLPMLSSGVRLWGSVLGRPASYGCIILTLNEAEELYNWAENGVIVEIQP